MGPGALVSTLERAKLDPVPSPGSSDSLETNPVDRPGFLSATVQVFMALRRGSNHLAWGGVSQGGLLGKVNLVASQVEIWGKTISDRRSNRSGHVLQ